MKDQLIAEISWRVHYTCNDCLTFVVLRNNLPEWFKAHEGSQSSRGLGGGNFTIAQGLFALLNLLAKIHRLLTKPKEFVTSGDSSSVVLAIARITAELPDLAGVVNGDKTKWKPPDAGSCNEASAWGSLVSALAKNSEIDLGLSGNDIGKVWNWYRNSLAHMSVPLRSIRVTLQPSNRNVDFDRLREGVRSQGRAFQKDPDGALFCNVDRLVFDLQDIGNWLCELINKANDERVQSAMTWLVARQQHDQAPVTSEEPDFKHCRIPTPNATSASDERMWPNTINEKIKLHAFPEADGER